MGNISFSIPYPPTKKGMAAWNRRFSLNAYWSGKHYRQRAEDARFVHQLTVAAMRRARVRKQPFKGPVKITFSWADKLDCSNHAALGKMIEDAMKGYVIQDDSPRWVREITNRFHEGAEIRVEVEEV